MNTKVLINLFVDQWEKNIEQFTFNNGKMSLFWDYSDYFLNQNILIAWIKNEWWNFIFNCKGSFCFPDISSFNRSLISFLFQLHAEQLFGSTGNILNRRMIFFQILYAHFYGADLALNPLFSVQHGNLQIFLFIIYRIVWTVQSFNIHILYGSSSIWIYVFVYIQITIIYCFPIAVIFFEV